MEPCYCGATCNLDFIIDEPCYGKVDAVDEISDGEDYYWVHSCEGHVDCLTESGPYKRENNDNS